MRSKVTAAMTLAALASSALSQGQETKAAPQTPASSRIEGDWVREDVNGSGSFEGLDGGIARAQLTPAGESARAAMKRRTLAPLSGVPHKAGEAYVVVDQPCYLPIFFGGALGVNPDSAAIHIVESKFQVVIVPERQGYRVIHVDGRSQPDSTHLTPSNSGYGVGHYDQGTLVSDTVGLKAGPVPGGGWRTPETHLTERFEVSADGQHLTIHYTYSDPKIYLSPHSYQYTFERLRAGSYALEDWCDASDPKERNSVVPQAQQ
jgi:hypothetical protein